MKRIHGGHILVAWLEQADSPSDYLGLKVKPIGDGQINPYFGKAAWRDPIALTSLSVFLFQPKTGFKARMPITLGIGADNGINLPCSELLYSLLTAVLGSPAARYINRLLVSKSPTLQMTFDFMSDSLSTCLKSHERCSLSTSTSQSNAPESSTRLPTRVLYIGFDQGSKFVRLMVTEGGTGRFVALSHCWGRSQHFTTASSTLQDRLSRIAIDTMPKTFRDAVYITRKLSIQYLWIDSLCIYLDRTRTKYRRNLRFHTTR